MDQPKTDNQDKKMQSAVRTRKIVFGLLFLAFTFIYGFIMTLWEMGGVYTPDISEAVFWLIYVSLIMSCYFLIFWRFEKMKMLGFRILLYFGIIAVIFFILFSIV